jgi:hypothetical protein
MNLGILVLPYCASDDSARIPFARYSGNSSKAFLKPLKVERLGIYLKIPRQGSFGFATMLGKPLCLLTIFIALISPPFVSMKTAF